MSQGGGSGSLFGLDCTAPPAAHHLTTWAMRPLSLLLLLLGTALVAFVSRAQGSPMPSPRDIETEMRLIPQNHCLRFRKFDLIKRCRRYRVRRHR